VSGLLAGFSFANLLGGIGEMTIAPPSPNPFGNDAEDERSEENQNGSVEATEACA
jgi:hypothetical protein